MAARHDHRIRVRREIRAIDPGRNVVDDDFDRLRKPLAVGEFLAVVDDVDAKTDVGGEAAEMKANMAGTDDV